MMQSRPNVFKLKLMRLWVFITFGLLSVLIIEWMTDWVGMNGSVQYIIVLAIGTGLFGIFIELSEISGLTISDDRITVRNLLTGKTEDTLFETIDGFKISIRIHRYRGLKFKLILLKQETSLEPISLSYMDNLDEIINELEKRLINSTEDEYDLLKRRKQE